MVYTRYSKKCLYNIEFVLKCLIIIVKDFLVFKMKTTIRVSWKIVYFDWLYFLCVGTVEFFLLEVVLYVYIIVIDIIMTMKQNNYYRDGFICYFCDMVVISFQDTGIQLLEQRSSQLIYKKDQLFQWKNLVYKLDVLKMIILIILSIIAFCCSHSLHHLASMVQLFLFLLLNNPIK